MQERQALFAVLAQIAESLRRLFDPFCEVVIHDFSDFEHSIIHLEGNITNRKLNRRSHQICCFPKHGAVTPMRDLSNYLTSLAGGRTLKSGTVFAR
ncbi:MAG: PAS domain-containing protein [Caldilineaceae bacterium]